MNEKQLDEAWLKLQGKLKQEPANDRWEQWGAGQQQSVGIDQTLSSAAQSSSAAASETGHAAEWSANQVTEAATTLKPSVFTRWKRNKYSKWVNGAVAAGLMAFIVLSPVGNKALAAILGQFRMEQITTIQEDEAEKLFYSFFPDGEARMEENRLGTFTRETGALQGEFSLNEAEAKVNRSIVVPEGFDNANVYIGSSEKITFKVNVDEINRMLSRVGATKLLPESIDGKPITLELGERISMDLNDGKFSAASFSQQPVPVIHVDPSVDMKEAVQAVIDLPLLPAHLKSSLKSSNILDGSGAVPLPVVERENTKLLKINGYNVLVEEHRYNEHTYYNALWIKDGQIFELSGSLFSNQEQLQDRIAELITQ